MACFPAACDPHLLCVVEGEGKAHGSLHSLFPEGGLGCGWWERVALPQPVHWADLAGVCTCPQVCGAFGDRHQPAAPLLLCCWWEGVKPFVQGSWGLSYIKSYIKCSGPHGWCLAGLGLCWHWYLNHPRGASPLPDGFFRCHRILPERNAESTGEERAIHKIV